MNVNCKLTLTDEQRNVMHRRLTGKNTKGMVSRADVNQWVKDRLESFLHLGSPTTEVVTPQHAGLLREVDDIDMNDIDDIDVSDINVEELIAQNRLLQTRVNRLQHLIDTRGLKK